MGRELRGFNDFINLYALPRTLRFELVPIGSTRENMNKNLHYDDGLQTFLKDQYVEDAYQVLKPVLDEIHKEFISYSLECDESKKIDFSKYFEFKEELFKIDKKDKKYNAKKKEIEKLEKFLRKSITDLYEITGRYFIEKVGKNDKGKDILSKKGYKVLTEKGILQYIKINIDYFSDLRLNSREEITWKQTNKNLVEKQDLEKTLGDGKNFEGIFDGFYTYLGGFNQNRENYYSSEDKSTAVSNRIVNENLPKFVDNIFIYEKYKDEYEKIFNELKDKNITLKIKNREGNEKQINEFVFDIFSISHFNGCLSQDGIDKYNEKIGDNNYLINLYNQLNSKTEGYKKLSKFKILFKQIGCGDKTDFIKLIKDDKDLTNTLLEIKQAGEKYFKDNAEHDTLNDFMYTLKNLGNYKGVYINKQAINTISGKYFENWHEIQDKLVKQKVFKEDKKSNETIKIPDAVELSSLFEVLDDIDLDDWKQNSGGIFKKSVFDSDINDRIEKYTGDNIGKQNLSYIKRKTEIIKNSKSPSMALLNMLLDDLDVAKNDFLNNTDVIENDVVKITDFKNDSEKSKIKLWLDETIVINRILKYFVTKENRRSGDKQRSDVENNLKSLFEFDWFKSYDAVRNYLTKKPQSEINKLKLNFENSTLADGWDVNKEKDNFCIILQDKNKIQYLVVLNNKNKKLFEQVDGNTMYNVDGLGWSKMNYKLLAGPNKMLPKVLFSKKWIEDHPTPENIKEIYKNGSFKKGDYFNKNDLHTLINFYKDELKLYPTQNKSWQDIFDFNFSNTNNYEGIDEFYAEVEKQGYKLEFIPINKTMLDSLVEQGRIYLFKIKNQDYNDNKSNNHKKNLHTIYWQAIFGDVKNKPKLNGEAEVFYRSALSLDKMKKKKDGNGKQIVENFRYSKEKFIFHCPITLNFGSKGSKINDLINQGIIKNSESITFLGIDRGEKHLAYYSLVDKNGISLKQGSFNGINGQDYNAKLETLSKNRDEARKSWQTIGTIKELKDGYISQVVHEIVKLSIENNALVILEDLNTGFKRGRQKIEKQVYQKLELALAKKLNFVVDKQAKDGEILSVQKALQLTPQVGNFGDIEKYKQVGIMLYTRANYTSQTDPKTGWRKSIYLKKGSEESIKKQILEYFIDFGFDQGDYYFEYTDKNTGLVWRLYSGMSGVSLDRYRGKRDDHNTWKIEKVDIVSILDGVFKNFDKSKSFRGQIIKDGIELKKVGNHTAWESLRYAIDLIQQIRNSGPKDNNGNPTIDDDFILSPIKDEKGKHFDSRDYINQENPEYPSSGDSNGAYNIARKGIMMFERIRKDPQKPKLFISDSDWDNFAQK